MIPKIIHQTAPKNKNLWHPIWSECHNSWKKHFSETEYVHMMWNDEDIDRLVKYEFPEYLELYTSFSFHIIKIDFIRYCILYKYGGIYADMDMFCYKNFYDELNKDCCLVGSIFTNFGELVQNSLMISSINNIFFKNCMDEILKTYKPFNESEIWTDHVIKSSGPVFLSRLYHSFDKTLVEILPYEEYNNDYKSYNYNSKTRHMMTGRWGHEMIEILKERHLIDKNLKNESHEKYLIYDYYKFREINITNFNFYE